MKRAMMIAVVIAVSFALGPVSAFAGKDYNSSISNTTAIDFNSEKSNTTSISKMTTQANCKKAGGVWGVDVDVPSKGICMNKADAAKHVIRFKSGADLAGDNVSRMSRSCRRCARRCSGRCVQSGRDCFCFEPLPHM